MISCYDFYYFHDYFHLVERNVLFLSLEGFHPEVNTVKRNKLKIKNVFKKQFIMSKIPEYFSVIM